MRLSHRLALVFSLFGALIAGWFQYTHTRLLRGEVFSQVEAMGRVTLGAVQALAQAQARGGNYGELGRNFELLVRQAGVATIVVKDGRGRRLVGRSGDGRSIERRLHPGLPIQTVADGYYDVEAPVDLGNRGKGTVSVSFRTSRLDERLRQIKVESVRDGVMAFLAITLAAVLLGVWFGLNIERLMPLVESLPKDPDKFRPIRSLSSGDETSRLIAAFNHLGTSLRSETLRRRQVEQEKQELAAMLVHDLKAPLTVIHSGISLLQDQWSDGAPRKKSGPNTGGRTFELLSLSVNRLRRMVEDVLHLARLEEIEGLREPQPVDLAEMARSGAKDFELVARDRGQAVALSIGAGPMLVEGDAALLRRVLDNLVYNAIEHNKPDSPVTITVEESGDHGVRVSVSDCGSGVPPEARDDIFKKFFQTDIKRHVGNVGLGLALCLKAIQRHGGTIGVSDAQPHGACFYFTLPRVSSRQ